MTRPVLSPLPPPPVRSDAPVDFSTKADAFLGAFPTLQAQINSATAWIGSQVDTTASDVLASQAARTAAETARDQAQTARNEAVSANTNAQSAKTAAESANTSAQTAKTAAETAKGQAESARDDAEDARDLAEYWAGQAEATVLDPTMTDLIASKAPLESPSFTGTVEVNGQALGTAATRAVGTSSGNLMEVGAGGWMSNSAATIEGYPANEGESITRVFRSFTEGNGVAPYAASLHVATANAWGRVRIGHASRSAWVQGGYFDNTTQLPAFEWTAELYHTGNTAIDNNGILHNGSSVPAGKQSVTADDLAAALASFNPAGPRPVKDHGAVATAGSQTVVCNVQESDFHMLDMSAANTTGSLTIDFANMPDTVGKHFSWHVRLFRGGRKPVLFTQTIEWSGGVEPSYGSNTTAWDTLMFYKVGNEPIRGMVIDVR